MERKNTRYGNLGAKIELNMTQNERNSFWRINWQSSDQAMAKLACFARFKHSATYLRLAGRTDEAQLQDANADTIFEREIEPQDRW